MLPLCSVISAYLPVKEIEKQITTTWQGMEHIQQQALEGRELIHPQRQWSNKKNPFIYWSAYYRAGFASDRGIIFALTFLRQLDLIETRYAYLERQELAQLEQQGMTAFEAICDSRRYRGPSYKDNPAYMHTLDVRKKQDGSTSRTVLPWTILATRALPGMK